MLSKLIFQTLLISIIACSLVGCGFYQSAPAPIENGWHPVTSKPIDISASQQANVTVTPLPSVEQQHWQKKSLPISDTHQNFNETDNALSINSAQTGSISQPTQLGSLRGGVQWQWPARGKIQTGFSGSNKGIEISGKMGQPIYAAASGVVLYAGSGLSGYGKLLIIKHNDSLLSAYAHNSQLLVKEGAMVNRGQKIALMGNSGSHDVGLHFEIRRNRQPVDPMPYLRVQ